MLVRGGNKLGEALAGKQVSVSVTDSTKVRRSGRTTLADLVAGELLLVQAAPEARCSGGDSDRRRYSAGKRSTCSRQSRSLTRSGGRSTSEKRISASFGTSRFITQPSERPSGSRLSRRATGAFSMTP
jgi:hypothetical protein